jgi:hypothetical protein
MNGDGVVDAADVVMLQRKAAGLDLNPVRHGSKAGATDDSVDPMLLSVILADRESMTVSLPGVIPTAAAGATVDVPININDATGLSGYDVQLTFPQELEVVEVLDGTVTGGGAKQIRTEPGTLNVSLGKSAGVVPSGSKGYQQGTLATVRFKVPTNSTNGTTYEVQINKAELKGQFGDSFGWYTRVMVVNGKVGSSGPVAMEGESGVVEGEPVEGEVVADVDKGCFGK